MLIVDDFLIRRYWFLKQKSAWGKNIPLNYKTSIRYKSPPFNYENLSIEDELNTLKKLKKLKVEFMPFITGYVLDMALGKNDKYGFGGAIQEELKKAIMWLVDNKIRIGGHGYYHTEQELKEKYIGWAKKVFDTLSSLQKPPHIWRFPKEIEVNNEYLEKMGFKILSHPDIYYDHSLSKNLGELFKLSKSNNVMVHGLYLSKYL